MFFSCKNKHFPKTVKEMRGFLFSPIQHPLHCRFESPSKKDFLHFKSKKKCTIEENVYFCAESRVENVCKTIKSRVENVCRTTKSRVENV